jgi:hypothetical protein
MNQIRECMDDVDEVESLQAHAESRGTTEHGSISSFSPFASLPHAEGHPNGRTLTPLFPGWTRCSSLDNGYDR